MLLVRCVVEEVEALPGKLDFRGSAALQPELARSAKVANAQALRNAVEEFMPVGTFGISRDRRKYYMLR